MHSQGSPTAQELNIPEIGSDFELVESKYLNEVMPRRLPWEEEGSNVIYVESGRQALAVVEAELRSQGHTHLHVPSYLCDSMISPFQGNGWTLEALPMSDDLAVSPMDLLSQVTAGVLLHTPYFGRQDSPETLDALDALRRRGVTVVVDETHRVFSTPSAVADIRVASLRKSLPLYDGAYVVGVSGPLEQYVQNSPPRSEIAALHKKAMVAKSNALTRGDDSATHRLLFERAEHATETQTKPAQISQESLSLLYRLDTDLIRTTRELNSNQLMEALGHSERFRVINPPAKDLLPFYLELDTNEVAGLQRSLAGQRIYCPIHWPPSDLLPRARSWPSRYLSLPMDHRYGESDMLRLATAVRAYFEGRKDGS
jgi:hypothetical protein